MFPNLPPSITHLVLLFALSTPLLSYGSPVDPTAVTPGSADAPTKLQPRAPQMSRRMGQRRSKKTETLKKKDYSQFLCPGGSVACPVPPPSLADITPASIEHLSPNLNSLGDWFKVGFECVELEVELNSCGGCLALGAGQDCSTIPNTRATGCEKGSCQVYTCFDGYVVTPDRKTCVKKGTVIPPTPITAFQQVVMEEKLE